MKLYFNTSNIDEAIENVKKWKYRPPIIEQAKVRQVADRIFNEGNARLKSPALTREVLQKGFEILNRSHE